MHSSFLFFQQFSSFTFFFSFFFFPFHLTYDVPSHLTWGYSLSFFNHSPPKKNIKRSSQMAKRPSQLPLRPSQSSQKPSNYCAIVLFHHYLASYIYTFLSKRLMEHREPLLRLSFRRVFSSFAVFFCIVFRFHVFLLPCFYFCMFFLFRFLFFSFLPTNLGHDNLETFPFGKCFDIFQLVRVCCADRSRNPFYPLPVTPLAHYPSRLFSAPLPPINPVARLQFSPVFCTASSPLRFVTTPSHLSPHLNCLTPS